MTCQLVQKNNEQTNRRSNESKMKKIEMKNYSNYKFKTCAYCKNEMILSEDDILFDKSWYHKECWSLTQN